MLKIATTLSQQVFLLVAHPFGSLLSNTSSVWTLTGPAMWLWLCNKSWGKIRSLEFISVIFHFLGVFFFFEQKRWTAKQDPHQIRWSTEMSHIVRSWDVTQPREKLVKISFPLFEILLIECGSLGFQPCKIPNLEILCQQCDLWCY